MSGRRELCFALVDVFAVAPLTGNPLAVILGGESLETEQMMCVARELNQSETTFVLPPERPGADRRLRSFTPMQTEIWGAGHNSLGAWWWLADRGELDLGGTGRRFTQQIGNDLLAVDVVADGGRPVSVVLEQSTARAGAHPADLAALTAALGIGVEDVAKEPVPTQVVSTGDAHLLLPLRDRAAVDRVEAVAEPLFAILDDLGAEGCYPFSRDAPDPRADAYARFLNPVGGDIWEDPASGGAAGPLAWQLHTHGLIARDAPFVVEQGTRMGRSSLIEVRLTETSVNVRGSATTVAEGRLRI